MGSVNSRLRFNMSCILHCRYRTTFGQNSTADKLARSADTTLLPFGFRPRFRTVSVVSTVVATSVGCCWSTAHAFASAFVVLMVVLFVVSGAEAGVDTDAVFLAREAVFLAFFSGREDEMGVVVVVIVATVSVSVATVMAGVVFSSFSCTCGSVLGAVSVFFLRVLVPEGFFLAGAVVGTGVEMSSAGVETGVVAVVDLARGM